MAFEGLDFFIAKRQLEEKSNNIFKLTSGNFPSLTLKNSSGPPSSYSSHCSCSQSQVSPLRRSYAQSVTSDLKSSDSSRSQSSLSRTASKTNSFEVTEAMSNLSEEEIVLWQRIILLIENSHNRFDVIKKISELIFLKAY